ncbi:hypothetical protein Bca4012_088768 [Brassica carinata]
MKNRTKKKKEENRVCESEMESLAIERASSTIEKGLQVCESEMESLAIETRTCCSVVSGYEKELRGFEKEIEDVKMELKSLKNMVVCVVVFGLLYKLFM